MHLMNVNTPMLQKAGIDRFTDTDGVLKFEDGEPTGELQEFAAMFPVTKYIGNPFRTLSMAPESLQNFTNICRIAGVTTATEIGRASCRERMKTVTSAEGRQETKE